MEDYEYPELEIGDIITTDLGETLKVVGFEHDGCPILKPVKGR